MKQFLKNNINFFLYLFFAIVLELSSLFVMTGNLFIKYPFIGLSIIGILFAIVNFCKSRTAKNSIITVFFIIQCVINIFCVILFENTGTLFDFSMIYVAEEGTTFLNAIDLNTLYLFYVLLLLAVFILATSLLNKYIDKYYRCKLSVITSSICLVVFLTTHIASVIVTDSFNEDKFINSIYKDTGDKYTSLGGSANFINELYKMAFFNNYNDLSKTEIENYIYEETNTPTEMFEISKDNNLVTILAESFEWISFISNSEIYPNGANLSEEKLDALYPNLRAFYNMSVIMNNHYSQNKTDISEDEALMGAYPSSDYISYIYPNNTYSTSIANSIKMIDNSVSNNFFHNNVKGYYNRDQVAKSLGYDNLYFIEEMVEEGVHDYMSEAGLGGLNMNLDTEMVEKMKDYMFPTDKRFNTHITSISMHGNYEYRKNMQRWLDKMEDLEVTIENDNLRNYMAAVMEFDCAIGLIIEDLENKNLLDNTTIVIFSDHNTYLSSLTYYVKDTSSLDYHKENYNQLYRVPLMIYDPNIPHQIVNKFTTTYDIVPTILDMFGINYYTNLYYGNSIFSEEESILYSKAFVVFIADGLYFSNINNILYKKDGVTGEYIKEIEEKGKALLKKIYYTNHIFNYNYFKNNNVYIQKFNSLNSTNN